MTDERLVTIQLPRNEAQILAAAVGWQPYNRTEIGRSAYSRVRAALQEFDKTWPEIVTANDEAPPPEKPKRGRPRKTTTTK